MSGETDNAPTDRAVRDSDLLAAAQALRDRLRNDPQRAVAPEVLAILREALGGELETRVAQRTRDLALSHRRFERLAERSPGGIFTVDLEGRLTYASRRWCEITGWTDQQALGRPWTSFCRDPETQRTFALPQDAYLTAPQLRFDLLMPRPDGAPLHVLVQLDRFGGDGRDGDEHTGWVGTVTDVSNMKRTETVLRALVAPQAASEDQRLRDIARQFREALDVDFVFVSTAAGARGESCRIVASATVPGLEPVPIFPVAGTPWADIGATGLLVIPDGVQARYPDDPNLGTWRAEGFAAVTLLGHQGDPIGHFGLIGRRALPTDGDFEPLLRLGGAHVANELERARMDEDRASLVAQLEVRVAERTAMLRAASEAAISAEASLRELTDSAPGAVFQFEVGRRRARLRFVSQGVERLVGGPSHFQRRLGGLWLAADRKERRRALRTVLPAIADLQPWSVELRLRGEDAIPRWVQVAARPLKRQGPGSQWVGSAVDITTRVANEEQLRTAHDAAETASRTKTRFLATISHEIRTPLHGIVGLLEVLRLSHPDADQMRTIELAEGAAESLQRLINDLLAFSHFEAGGVDLRPQPMSLREFADNVESLWRSPAEKKGLQFHVGLDARLPPAIHADELRLRQVIDNLLSNAVKFTASGGIEISIRDGARDSRPGRLLVQVRDTGIGIPEEAVPRLFQPFTQAESDTNRRFGGTGLGLAICFKITEAMGGSIAVEHPAAERGTSIVVELPMLPATLPTGPEVTLPAAVVPPESGPRKRALIAEDNEVNRLLIARQLDHLGYDHTIVEDGLSAFWSWSVEPYDVVITDCHMPELDGYQLTQMIRQEEGNRGKPPVPIIALTADAYSDVAERCARVGMNGVITKPATIESLRRTLSDLFESGHGAAPGPAAAGSADEAAPWIDREQLEAITGGNREVVSEMLAAFLRTLDDETRQVHQAFDENDPASIKRGAHRLKGFARAVGATRMAEHAAAIERCTDAEDHVAATELRSGLDAVADATRRAIELEQRS